MTSLSPKEADFKIKSILVREFHLIISDDSSLSSPSLAEKFDSDSSSDAMSLIEMYRSRLLDS